MKKEYFNRHQHRQGGNNGKGTVEVPDYDPNFAHFYVLAFSNFPSIVKRKEIISSETEEAKHIKFIISAGSSLKTNTLCPCCHKNKVTHFSLKDGKPSPCCSNNKCKCYCAKDGNTLYPFQLDVFTLNRFQSPAEKQKLESFFKIMLGLPERLSPDILHNFLKKSYEQQIRN